MPLSWRMVTEFKAALAAIDQDNQCRAVVITGAGESFSAGLNLMDQGNRQSLSEAIGELGDGPRARDARPGSYMAEIVLLNAGCSTGNPLLRRGQMAMLTAGV